MNAAGAHRWDVMFQTVLRVSHQVATVPVALGGTSAVFGPRATTSSSA